MVFEIIEDIIEIPEDDYKKNEVYRPWTFEDDTKTAEQTGAKRPGRQPVTSNVVSLVKGTTRPGV